MQLVDVIEGRCKGALQFTIGGTPAELSREGSAIMPMMQR
jgi:hypothetical protein